ncbi:MAG: hypothetical protein ACYC96_11290 [Fimbriimonadaceae bacterium]
MQRGKIRRHGEVQNAGRLALAIVVTLAAAPSYAFDTRWHMDATRVAMAENGFSPDARLLTQLGNYLTDFFSAADLREAYKHLPGGAPAGWPTGLEGIDIEDVARLHFDALTSEAQVEHQWKTLEANTVAALKKWSSDPSVKPGFRATVLLTIVGSSLHAVQDFYSHSNWLKVSGGNAPLWFDVPMADRQKLDVRTGWYPDGNDPGVLYHKDENKDSTGRPMNAEAVAAATRASTDWVKRIIAEAPDVPWDTLRAWQPKPLNVAAPWLRKADATFITSTSTLAGHWDGPTPAANVFSPDAGKNKRIAAQALLLTLSVYAANMAMGTKATPTPYWVGFTIYHVERDLAKNLYLQNKLRQ